MLNVNFKNGCIVYTDFSGACCCPNESDLIVMQYVGFDDMNGAKIFEGDIDQYGWVITYVADLHEGLGMEAGWYSQRDDFESWANLECNHDTKIIGNVFENLEKSFSNQNVDYRDIVGGTFDGCI